MTGWSLFSCPASRGRESQHTASRGYNRSTVPELPDLTVVAEAFHAALAGRAITGATALAPLAVRGTPAELDALVGQQVDAIRRRGKFLLARARPRRRRRQSDAHGPVSAGRARRQAPIEDGRRHGASVPAKAVPPTRRAGRPERRGCPRTMPPSRSGIAIPPRWARSTCSRPASSGPCPALAATTRVPTPTIRRSRSRPGATRIRRHPGELKNLLRNQAFVAGIGNAYSDEILHAARLLPFRKRASLATEEVDALYAATRTTLVDAIESCASACHRPSRGRCGTSWRCTTRAVSHARVAGPGSPRSGPVASSRRIAAAASADARRAARGSAELQDLADVDLRGIRDLVECHEHLDRGAERRSDAAQRVALLDLVGRSGVPAGDGVGLASVGTRVGRLGRRRARSARGSPPAPGAAAASRGGRRRPTRGRSPDGPTAPGREPRDQHGHERDHRAARSGAAWPTPATSARSTGARPPGGRGRARRASYGRRVGRRRVARWAAARASAAAR